MRRSEAMGERSNGRGLGKKGLGACGWGEGRLGRLGIVESEVTHEFILSKGLKRVNLDERRTV